MNSDKKVADVLRYLNTKIYDAQEIIESTASLPADGLTIRQAHQVGQRIYSVLGSLNRVADVNRKQITAIDPD